MVEHTVFTPEATADITESYVWYENREHGLGEEFLRCLEACFEFMQRHPDLYPVAIDDFRRAPIRRFPFEIFYRQTGKFITVYAVFNCSQNPQKWRERLER